MPYKSWAKTRKSFALFTMNVLTSAHHHSRANFKRKYAEHIESVIKQQPLPTFTGITIDYVMHTKPTRGKPIKSNPYRGSSPKNMDLLNASAMTSKVFLDVLTHLAIIPDDTITYVHRESFISDPWSDFEGFTITLTPSVLATDPRISNGTSRATNSELSS